MGRLALERVRRVSMPNQISKASLKTTEAIEHLAAYTSLMAPLIFPQLYPACARMMHPDPHINVMEAKRLMSKSQDREDVTLYDMFFKNDKEPGVFLEIGALNEVTFSNTFFYEHALGWKGILVEANPKTQQILDWLKGRVQLSLP